jgi:hypothetical protein
MEVNQLGLQFFFPQHELFLFVSCCTTPFVVWHNWMLRQLSRYHDWAAGSTNKDSVFDSQK